MSWFKENKFNILVNFVNLIFITIVMKICYRIQDFDFLVVVISFFMGLAVFYFYSAILKKTPYKILFSCALVFMFSLLVYSRKEAVINYIINHLVENFNAINSLLYRGASTQFELFKPFIMGIFPIVVIILLALYSRGLTESVLVLNLSILSMFWYLQYVVEIKSVLLPFIALSVATITVNNHMKFLKKVSRLGVKHNLDGKVILFNIVIYSVIVAVIAMILPQDFKGNYSKVSMYTWANPFSPDPNESIGRAKDGRYGLSSSGYSNSERELGGPLTLNSELVFQVKSEKPLYLRGDVKAIYTGKSWIKGEENYQTKSDISDSDLNKFLETNLGVSSTPNKINVTIIPKAINTNTLFVPYYTSKVLLDKGKIYFEANGETFVNSSKITREYTLEIYDPQKVAEYVSRRYSYRDLNVRRNRNDNYLTYPKEITQRTIQLVNEITRGARTNKDKVNAIEAYLTKTYPYSLEVSALPANEEFLDYFLFTEKKGYCTYFATAMTIMCRIAGVPARYVEGFKMPSNSANGIFDVTNEQAHAWTEVLYQEEPQLWVVKDTSPTPQEEIARIQSALQSEFTPVPEATPEIPIEELPQEENEMAANSEVDEIGELNYISYKFIALIAVILIILGYVFARILLYRYKRDGVLKHESNIPLYNYCIKRLKAAGFKKQGTETDRDFVNNIDNLEFRNYMSELVDGVYGEFYGGMKSTEFDKKRFYNELEEFVKIRQNIFMYVISKYFV